MTEETYETVKTIFAEHERLFTKLLKVAREYDAIDFDESGLYEEDAERCERHWNTLASKLAGALREALEETDVKVLQNPEPNICTIRFDITTPGEEGEETSRLRVDYATEGQLSVARES
jgi:hypothetical protein